MNLYDFLTDFINQDCSCGKSHKVNLPRVIVKAGALADLPSLISEYSAKKVFVLADVNTNEVAGQKVFSILDTANIKYEKCIFQDKELEPDERAVGGAIMRYRADCDLIIAVGSGVINDIGKIVATVAKKPYFIIGTAPSMDGYASSLSSMAMDGLKISIPSKYAEVILGDVDIIKQAPLRMLRAGLGDMLAKYISITDWRVSNVVNGEYYCERIADLVRISLKRCVDNAEGLLKRDEEAVKAVFEGLIICGLAMAMVGVSRPASGTEHNFSHFFDMRGLEFGTKVELHGIQCAVGTLLATKFYQKTLSIIPCKEKALSFVKNFDFAKWSEQLRKFVGKASDAMIALEQKEQKYNVEKHEKRLENIIDKWQDICEVIRQECPTVEKIEYVLDLIGIPKTLAELGIDCDEFLAFKATKDIRDKYMLSRLLWDLGELDDFDKR